MDIRLDGLQPDSNRYSDGSPKKRKAKTKGPHEEEDWSERSDYTEIEDTYTPSEKPDEEDI